MILLIAVITYIFTAIRNKCEIRFTDQYIEFLDKGIIKRQCKLEEEVLRRNFSTENFRASSFIVLVVLCVGSLGIFLVALIFMYIINMVLKLIVYFYINRSLKGFKIFPFIKVARPGYGKYLYNAVAIAAHYYLIYIAVKFTTRLKSTFCRKI